MNTDAPAAFATDLRHQAPKLDGAKRHVAGLHDGLDTAPNGRVPRLDAFDAHDVDTRRAALRFA